VVCDLREGQETVLDRFELAMAETVISDLQVDKIHAMILWA
jgi:hypothetical protein